MQILEGGKVKKIWRQNAAEWGDRMFVYGRSDAPRCSFRSNC